MKVGHRPEDDCRRAAAIMAKLNLQRTQVHFCDCVLTKGQGHVYPVHRCILAASSPVLASILCSSGVLVELETPCLSDSILELLLDFIYTGTLPHLDHSQYSYLLSAAQYLEMDELQNALRTKAANALGCQNNCDVATRPTLLPSRTFWNQSPPQSSPHSGHTSESENPQEDPHWTPLSNSGYAIMNASLHDCGFSETAQKSHKLIQSVRSCNESQKNSTMSQNIEKNLSPDALKPDIWQESKEREIESCVFTKVQEDEENQDEETPGFDLQEHVKAEEVSPIPEVQSHNSYSCSTSVIRHSSRVSRTPEGTAPTELCQDMEIQHQHRDNQNLELPALPDHAYSVHSFNLIQNYDSKHPFERESNKKEHDLDLNSHKFMPRVCTINTTIHSQHDRDVTPFGEQQFQNKRMCAKRKPTEEQSNKCSKSAKRNLVYSAETEVEANDRSVSNRGQDTARKDKNTSNNALYGSMSAPTETSTFQFCTFGPAPSYSGHLFYHCESQTDRSSSGLMPFSDKPTQDNGASIFSGLRNEKAALGEGKIVLLDISSKSSEVLVSYKQTSMGTAQNEKSRNQRDDDGPRVGETSMTSCASSHGRDREHSSTSQTEVSGRPVSPALHPFQCSLCERSFSQRGSLNRHVRSHLGVRPFPCPHCPMTFSRQYRVTEHMRVHQRSDSDLGPDLPKPPASSV